MTQRPIDLVDELVLHINGQVGKNNYLQTVLNDMILLSTKYYQNCLMNVEDIASHTRVVIEHD